MGIQEVLHSRLKVRFLQTTPAHGLPGSWLAGFQSQQGPDCSSALLCSHECWHMCHLLAAHVMIHAAGCLQHCSPGYSKGAPGHSSKSTLSTVRPVHELQDDYQMEST